jgi:lipid A 3-O-deacylase
MMRYLLTLALSLGFSSMAMASFYDRPDYFDSKEFYDQISDIVETLYSNTLTPKEIELYLRFKDQKLVPVLKALKEENERILADAIKAEAHLSDAEIAKLMRERPTMDALRLTLENDAVAGTDRYYTNGLRFEISFNNPKFEAFFKKLGFDHSDFFLLCGQEIYNTSDRDVSEIMPNEPGNAGVLHCGGAVNSYKMDQDRARNRSMQRLEAQIGVVGRAALAEPVQNAFHALITDKAAKWDYQLGDRFFFNVNFEKYIKVGEGNIYGDSKPEYNVIINGGGNVGTFTNYVNAGVILNYRLLGTLIDMYVGNKLTPSTIEELAMMSPENRLKRILCGSNWSINLYFGVEGRYVINNYRIDGSDDYDVEVAPLVFDLKGGVVVRYKKVFLELGVVRRASEWNNTAGHHNGYPHTWGTLSLTYTFANYGELGEAMIHPVRWMVDPQYRKKLQGEGAIRKALAKEGITILIDDADTSKPARSVKVTCN